MVDREKEAPAISRDSSVNLHRIISEATEEEAQGIKAAQAAAVGTTSGPFSGRFKEAISRCE